MENKLKKRKIKKKRIIKVFIKIILKIKKKNFLS
jgi:hypothetical protein